MTDDRKLVARIRGGLLSAAGILGLVIGGASQGQAPMLILVGVVGLTVGIVYLVAASLMRD